MKLPKKFLTIILLIDILASAALIYNNSQIQSVDIDEKICEQGVKYKLIGYKWSKLPITTYIDNSISNEFKEETIAAFDHLEEVMERKVFQIININSAQLTIRMGSVINEQALGETKYYPVSETSSYLDRVLLTMSDTREFEIQDFSCDLLDINYQGPWDWRTIMTHELGHVLGLDHTDDKFTTMHDYYTGTFGATLSQGDINGLKAIYN